MSKRTRTLHRPSPAEPQHVGAMAIYSISVNGRTWPTSTAAGLQARLKPHSIEAILAACNRECRLAEEAGGDRLITDGPLEGFYIPAAGIAAVARQALAVCEDNGYLPNPANALPAPQDAVRRAVLDAYHHSSAGSGLGSVSLRSVTSLFYRYLGLHSGVQQRYGRTIPRYLALFRQPIHAHHGLGATLGHVIASAMGMPYEEYVYIAALLYAAAMNIGIFTLDMFAPFWTTMPTRAWCTREKMAAVIDRLALPLEDLQAKARDEQYIVRDADAEELPFGRNPLQEWPLVKFGPHHLLAPVPHFIWSRALEGAIFDVRDAATAMGLPGKNALDAQGDAVERYMGALLAQRYAHDAVLPEMRPPGSNEDGPDFVLIREAQRDAALLEVKSAYPTLRVTREGDVAELSDLLKQKIARAFRMLPYKERELSKDPRIGDRLRGRGFRVSHVVVTLGRFTAQALWWGGVMAPLLTAPACGNEVAYDLAHPHHLISVEDVENATAERTPHLVYLLEKTWNPQQRRELADEIRAIKPSVDELRHPYLDPIRDSWRAQYGIPEDSPVGSHITPVNGVDY